MQARQLRPDVEPTIDKGFTVIRLGAVGMLRGGSAKVRALPHLALDLLGKDELNLVELARGLDELGHPILSQPLPPALDLCRLLQVWQRCTVPAGGVCFHGRAKQPSGACTGDANGAKDG